MKAISETQQDRELVIEREVNVSAAKLFRCWTDPELMQQWFAPKPWLISQVELDVRPGGTNFFVMQGPEGEQFPSRGVYLEVIPNKKLVITDAYTEAWTPSENPFMTVILTLDEVEPGKTHYKARVLHWSVEDREKHEAMGFEPGWNQCLDQLIELASTL